MLLLLRGGREICQYIAVNSWHLTKTLFCSGSREAQKEVQDTSRRSDDTSRRIDTGTGGWGRVAGRGGGEAAKGG
jgi:hypothetical protein